MRSTRATHAGVMACSSPISTARYHRASRSSTLGPLRVFATYDISRDTLIFENMYMYTYIQSYTKIRTHTLHTYTEAKLLQHTITSKSDGSTIAGRWVEGVCQNQSEWTDATNGLRYHGYVLVSPQLNSRCPVLFCVL